MSTRKPHSKKPPTRPSEDSGAEKTSFASDLELTVLGVDPGSHFTGYGLVRVRNHKVSFLSCGVIAPPAQMSFHERIGVIAEEIEYLLEDHRPNITVIERVFLGKNADSAFKLGHARGVILAAAVRARSSVVEYAPRAVKKGITGNGAASKEQVQTVLLAALGMRGTTPPDASDALALAYFHSRNLDVFARLKKQSVSHELSQRGKQI